MSRQRAGVRTEGQVEPAPAGAPGGAGTPTPSGTPGARLLDLRLSGRPDSYAPSGRYLWDSWIFADGPLFRLFHLDAEDNAEPASRHDRAQIRGAVSKDLVHWRDVGPLLGSAPAGAWDDGAIWTGNTYREGDELVLFYTARNQREGQTQRIGLATSKDGVHFTRGEAPLLSADPRWYETQEDSPVYRAFRDPFVFLDPVSGDYLMYVTAKTKDGDPTFRGCIGLARARTLRGPYEPLPPVLAPGLFAQMEVPQVIQRDGKTFLFFSAAKADLSPELAARARQPEAGLFGYVADDPRGPFRPLGETGLIAGSELDLYSVKLLDDPERPGEFLAFGWYREDTDTPLRLAIPRTVRWQGEKIRIESSPAHNLGS